MGSRKGAPNERLNGIAIGQDWKRAAEAIRKYPTLADEKAARDLPRSIEYFRKSRGYSQSELSKMCGARIDNIERGHTKASVPDLLRIAAALEVRPELLLAVTSIGASYLADAYEHANGDESRQKLVKIAELETHFKPQEIMAFIISNGGMFIDREKVREKRGDRSPD